jgi:hypothetical protein
MRSTFSKEKIAKLEQYQRDVAAWVEKNGPIPEVPVQRAKVDSRTIRQRDRDRLKQACLGVKG